MNAIVIIQARLHSQRLPQKVLLPLAGKPVLQHVIERALAANVGPVVVATGDKESNRPIWELAQANSVGYFTYYFTYLCDEKFADHIENDVFTRFRLFLDGEKNRKGGLPELMLRVTADCVLLEPAILQALAARAAESTAGYINGSRQAGFADGVGAELMRTDAFMRIEPAMLTDFERENPSAMASPYMAEMLGPVEYLQGLDEYKQPYKLSLDTEEDYQLLKHLFDVLGPEPKTLDVLRYLDEHPEWESARRPWGSVAN